MAASLQFPPLPSGGEGPGVRGSRRRQRGFTIHEGLVASGILTLALTGLFVHWAGMFRRATRARETSQAALLARAEVERAKVFGTANLPQGTYAPASASATWTGAYGASGWVANGFAYFDASGKRLAGSSGARYRLQATISDSGLMGKTGGYGFSLKSRRNFVVAASLVPEGTTIFHMGTIFTPGGL